MAYIQSMTTNFTLETEIGEIEIEADFAQGGIGSYECHGYKGYDSHPELIGLRVVSSDASIDEAEKWVEYNSDVVAVAAWNEYEACG